MKWILKAIVQKTISFLPNSQKVNYWFQKNITKGVTLNDQYFSDKLGHAVDHIKYFKQFGKTESFKVLELGSGWYPVVPIALYLAGADEIVSIDISPLMKREGIKETINRFVLDAKANKLTSLAPYIKEERLTLLKAISKKDFDFKELLNALHLRLEVTDARNTGFPEHTFDLVCSNNTYEHIYPSILRPIIKEFQRVVKPGGVNSHFIDMSDHFAHLDNSINIYNYLKFSKNQWTLIDNSIQPQNRMRLPNYEALYAEMNIEILHKEIRPGNLKELAHTPIHKDYTQMATKDIAISHAHLVSGK